MKDFIPYIALTLLTGFTFIGGMPTYAGGCNNHSNNKITNDCSQDEPNCKKNKEKTSELNKYINS